MPPPWITTTRSACFTVASRCAMTRTVRPRMSSDSACCTRNSLSASRSEVASSRIRIGGSFRNARAIARRWRLSAGELHAALAHRGRVALGQGGDEVVGLGQAGRVLDLGLRGAGLAVGDVVPDRVVEEKGVLGHDADQRAQRGHRDRRAVVPIHRDAPDADVVEPRQQVPSGWSCPRPTCRRRPPARPCRTVKEISRRAHSSASG